MRIETGPEDAELHRAISAIPPRFEKESLALSTVLDGSGAVASDFRVDASDFVRFALLAGKGMGARRIGRIAQRLIEIETYKSMAMLSLPGARDVSRKLSEAVPELNEIINDFATDKGAQDHEPRPASGPFRPAGDADRSKRLPLQCC